jgi:hypothetical protein
LKNSRCIWSILVCIILVSTTSCDKDVVVSSNDGFAGDYMNMRVGTTWIYQIDSMHQEKSHKAERFRYYQKEYVYDVTSEGRSTSFYVQSYISKDSTGPFKEHDRYTYMMYEDRVVRMGWDYNLIILSAPIEPGYRWNNLNNNCQYAKSIIESDNETFVNETSLYYDVLNVIHCAHTEPTNAQTHVSKYAKDAGLVYEIRSNRFHYIRTTITKSLIHHAY